MNKYLTFFFVLVFFTSLFQAEGFAYVEDEPNTEVALETPDSAFLPILPLADLVRPIEVLTAPSTMEDAVFPDHGEIIVDQNQSSSSL